MDCSVGRPCISSLGFNLYFLYFCPWTKSYGIVIQIKRLQQLCLIVVIMFFFAFLHFLLLPKEMSYAIVLDVRFFSKLYWK